MMLAAHELGLGTCCLGMPIPFMNSKQGEPFLASLGLPEGYALQFAIAIGYADEAPEAKPRHASKLVFVE
jgi:nitroreductase